MPAAAVRRRRCERARIYRRLPPERPGQPAPGLGTWRRPEQLDGAVRHARRRPGIPTLAATGASPGDAGRGAALAEVHFRLIERFAPPSLVVDSQHNVLHMSRKAGRYLSLRGGQPSRDLLQLAHPMLRSALRSALQQAEGGRADRDPRRADRDRRPEIECRHPGVVGRGDRRRLSPGRLDGAAGRRGGPGRGGGAGHPASGRSSARSTGSRRSCAIRSSSTRSRSRSSRPATRSCRR